MIAYNSTSFKNLRIKQAAISAGKKGLLVPAEVEAVLQAYPSHFYTPDFFIRVGLFVLTYVIMSFSFGLFALLSIQDIEKNAGIIFFIFAALSIAALEYTIREKRHYQSGIDDALLYGGIISILAGINIAFEPGNSVMYLLTFFLTGISVIRYADRLLAAVCFLSLLVVIFDFTTASFVIAKSFAPFAIMLVSLLVYFFVKKKAVTENLLVYDKCLVVVEALSLVTLYVAGNYFAVREMSNVMFDLQLQPGQSIPYGFVFWISTIIIPLLYLAIGIQKKDLVLLRTGLILVAAMVFTIRNYYALMAIETVLVISGSVLIFISWWLIRYLAVPKSGFTANTTHDDSLFKKQIESLVIAETFGQQQSSGTQFGGGSFGGGGASGDY